MYQIKCDGFHLYDYRLPELIVTEPKVKVAANTVGEASFVIHNNHPNYSQLKVLKSIFEISDEIGVIFRGRMTNNSKDFHNSKTVDLEGLMAFFNDSVVRPFKFPEDFAKNGEYILASYNGNVVEFFLKWLIDNHNSQVKDFQKFKLGNVTVADPNNYITRSESKYSSTWEVIKNKLFDSSLGGYVCIRYEEDGNYIDYLSEFELTNTQEIEYGENLLDLKNEIDAVNTYSAIIPLGAEIETEATDSNGEKIKKTLTLETVEDGEIAPGIFKRGDTLYSKSAVADYGWIYAPTEETTWSDVTLISNLQSKAIAFLSSEGIKLQNNIEINAIDLHCTDAEIRSFRACRNVQVNSLPHGQNGLFPLTELEIDLLKPQNTKIVLGKTRKTLSEITNDRYQGALEHIKDATTDLTGKVSSTINSLNELNNKVESIDGTYFYIRYSPYEDGHEMTNTPDENTKYMGTCSTNLAEAPKEHTLYTWIKVGGVDGRSVAKVENYYLTTDKDSGVTVDDEGWLLESIDKVSEEKPYLWNYEKTVYSDNNFSTSAPSLIGNYAKEGKQGVGIKEIQEWYALTNDKDTQPEEGDWSQELPKMSPDNRFLWNYEVIIYTDDSEDTTDPLIIGVYGDKGVKGDGSYLHIKYSNDGVNFTDNDGEDLGIWIGTYTDTIEEDSKEFSRYKWKKYAIDEAEFNDVKSIVEQHTTDIVRNNEQISMFAARSYVETSAFEQYQEEVQSEFSQTADEISMNFTTTTKQIQNVDGDLQAKFATISKYFGFTENGLIIGGGENALTLSIDNNGGIVFAKNGEPFGWWDGVDFHTSNIIVTVKKRAQFGEFAFVPRSSGSLSFLKVQGSNSSNLEHVHSYTQAVTKAATCTEYGTMGLYCSCGHSSTQKIPALGHNYVGVVTPPTETEQGYTTYTCSRCRDSYIGNYTDATGCIHDYEFIEVAPTCTEQGYNEYTCTKCPYSYRDAYKDATGHNDGNGDGCCDVCGVQTGEFFTITVRSNNTNYGTVSGGGTFLSGNKIGITATPNSGYKFTQWSDGNTNATRIITVSEDKTYIAYFSSGGSSGGGSTYTTDTYVGNTLYIGTETTHIETNYYYESTGGATEIVIPEGRTTIANGVFGNCTLLTKVTMPSTMTLIGTGAFSACPNLTEIHYNGTKSQWGNISIGARAFDDISKITIHCTDGDITSASGGSTETKSVRFWSGGALSVQVSRNGSVVGGTGTYEFNIGDTVTVYAEPPVGKTFDSWIDSSTIDTLSYDNPYTFVVSSSTPSAIQPVWI